MAPPENATNGTALLASKDVLKREGRTHDSYSAVWIAPLWSIPCWVPVVSACSNVRSTTRTRSPGRMSIARSCARIKTTEQSSSLLFKTCIAIVAAAASTADQSNSTHGVLSSSCTSHALA
eukprot:645372-Amphidinium_carterae.1